jgi:predicted NBD/HSP70 family sugar kinase
MPPTGGETRGVRLTIGIDVGGTKAAAGVVRPDGRIVEKLKRSTPAASPPETERVIGGGVSEAGSLLVDPARWAYERALPGRGYRDFADVRLAELGADAGVVGAADLARRHAGV